MSLYFPVIIVFAFRVFSLIIYLFLCVLVILVCWLWDVGWGWRAGSSREHGGGTGVAGLLVVCWLSDVSWGWCSMNPWEDRQLTMTEHNRMSARANKNDKNETGSWHRFLLENRIYFNIRVDCFKFFKMVTETFRFSGVSTTRNRNRAFRGGLRTTSLTC
jgi:type VI protein secretion system component VasK